MKRILLATAVVAVILGAQARAQSGYQLLQQALSKEQAEGNLKDAIAIYQRIAKEFAGDHALAAQALLHLGECYQKLGDAQARQMFQRVLREYADQKDAADTARARLGADPAPRAKGDRPVWSGGFVDGFGTISPDGRYLTYTDWGGSVGLMVHDLMTGTNRRLTGGTVKDGQTQYSAISRDGRQVAYEWLNAAQRYELRVVDLQSTGSPEPRRIVDIQESQEIAPFDWSPDNRWIAVHITRKDRTGQLALVRVSDGSVRVLKSEHWKGPLRISFSPDGQYIAYDLIVDEHPRERHVYVMAVDGSREAVAVDDHSGNAVMGWTPDGRHVLFSSDRSGSIDLWAVPINGGRPAGSAFLVKTNIGTFWTNGISANGTMYVWKEASPIYVQVASIDLAAGRLTTAPTAANRVFIGSRGRPVWSPDGRQIAYESCTPLGGGPCRFFVRSIDTGQIREIATPLQYLFFPHFSPDGRSIITRANDSKGRGGIYRIDVATGDTAFIAGQGVVAEAPGNGSTFVYEQRGPDGLTFFERDLTSGEQRQLVQVPVDGNAAGSVSPNRQTVAILSQSPVNRETTLSVMPTSGGMPRILLRVASPAGLWGAEPQQPEWTPDSRSVLVVKGSGDESAAKELWQVPIDGSPARKLDIDVNRWLSPDGGFRLSPDGKQIAFVAATGRVGQEIWALENFLPHSDAAPAQAGNRRTARK